MRLLAFVLLLIAAPLICGFYGVLNDQISYTVSEEYYTKFKFIQFGFIDDSTDVALSHPRLFVALVGFLASWWMGIPLGLILASFSLIHQNFKTMIRVGMKAYAFAVGAAFVTAIIGLIWGWIVLGNQPPAAFERWFIPDNLVLFRNFIAAGSMHNAAYAGGFVGLIVALGYHLLERNRMKSIT